MDNAKKWGAEFIGTFLLVLGGCGSAIFAAKALTLADRQVDVGGVDLGIQGIVNSGIGYLGVALAFGLTVVCGAYAFGHVSGGHFNPAVSVGLAAVKRFDWKNVPGYVIVQCLGAILAVAVMWAVQAGRPGGFEITQGAFASNAYGQNLETGRFFYDLPAAFIAEVVLTALFLIVILGVTTKAASKAMAGLSIGLTLTLIHLISIPITNTSVNPARSLGPALFERGEALAQLWLFIVAPLLGGVLGALVWKAATGGDETQTGESEAEGVEES
ncbi:MAG: aquaporin Z [Acidimicrobiia bacterium]|nr:aquaporin Z [Acidimicrobiia bacterium]